MTGVCPEVLGRKAVWGPGTEKTVCGHRSSCASTTSAAPCVGSRESGPEPWPSALYQARVLVMPCAGSFLTEKVLAYPCVLALDSALREGRDHASCGVGSLSPDWPLRTGVHCKSRCLTCGSVPYAAGESCIAIVPTSSLADRCQHC